VWRERRRLEASATGGEVLSDASRGSAATRRGDQVRLCAWNPRHVIPAGKRSDSEFCSKACRQASWRFGWRGPDRPFVDGPALRFAYADPPYPGMSEHYYGDHQDFAGEVDHRQLVRRLLRDFPDGWALSTSSATLHHVLRLCPPEVRVGAWIRPMTHTRGLKRPRKAWEPVIFFRGRERPPDAPLLLDWIYAPIIDWAKYPGGVIGMKPPEFSWWMFDCLGAQAGDELVDVFPGSGAVTRAWERYQLEAAAEGDTSLVSASPSEIAAAGRRRREKTSRATTVPGDTSPGAAASTYATPGQMDIEEVLAEVSPVDIDERRMAAEVVEVDRGWLPELDEAGERMDEVEGRIDELVDRLLPASLRDDELAA
jgi:hypothetical protein